MTGPLPRVTPNAPYEVCVYRTRTGEVVKWVPFEGLPRWESGLNVTGSWQVNAALYDPRMTKDELSQLIDPWHWSWAVVQGFAIHQAGPVTAEDFGDDGGTYTTITGAGLWAMYKQKRVLVNAGRTAVEAISGTDADVAFGPGTMSDKGSPIPLANRNLSLHTIIKRLLENEQAKPGGSVQLVLPVDIAGDSSRTYLGPELAKTGDRMYEITQVQDGPELELAAEFTNSNRTNVRHKVNIGNPRLGQLGYAHVWSYRNALTRLGFVSDGGRMRDRDWDRGAGFDRNVRTGFAENMEGVTSGDFQTRPLLEDVGSLHTNNDNETELDAYAASDVQLGRTPDLNFDAEVTMEGDNGDGSLPPSPAFIRVANGDTGIFLVQGHPRLADGRYYVRVIKKTQGSEYKRGGLTTEILGVQTL